MSTVPERYPQWLTDIPECKSIDSTVIALTKSIRKTLAATAQTEEEEVIARTVNKKKMRSFIWPTHTKDGVALAPQIRFNVHLQHKYDNERTIRKPVQLTPAEVVTSIQGMLHDFKVTLANTLIVQFIDDWQDAYKNTKGMNERKLLEILEESYPGELQRLYSQIRTGNFGEEDASKDAA